MNQAQAATEGPDAVLVTAQVTRRMPCPAHYEEGWQGRGLWDENCPACQETPAVVEHRVLGFAHPDPAMVVDAEGQWTTKAKAGRKVISLRHGLVREET